jgi:hypothetical protein
VGRPIANARLFLSSSERRPQHLASLHAGRAPFYPHALPVSGPRGTLTPASPAGSPKCARPVFKEGILTRLEGVKPLERMSTSKSRGERGYISGIDSGGVALGRVQTPWSDASFFLHSALGSIVRPATFRPWEEPGSAIIASDHAGDPSSLAAPPRAAIRAHWAGTPSAAYHPFATTCLLPHRAISLGRGQAAAS